MRRPQPRPAACSLPVNRHGFPLLAAALGKPGSTGPLPGGITVCLGAGRQRHDRGDRL
jgi:hypothetical protein